MAGGGAPRSGSGGVVAPGSVEPGGAGSGGVEYGSVASLGPAAGGAEVAEPDRVRAGLLARPPRGRVATPAAWTHLGLTAPADPAAPPRLFD